MKRLWTVAVAAALAGCASHSVAPIASDGPKLAFRVAYGSGNHQNESQEFWQKIAGTHPNVWVWLGDAIYADTRDAEVFRAKYQHLLDDPYYKAFRAQVHITGTWDHHDYGEVGAGAEYPLKDVSRDLYWDFIGIPAHNILRTHDAIYRTEIWTIGQDKVKLIILDERSFRDPLTKGDLGYVPSEGTLLGAAQWEWLEREVTAASDVSILVIASGTQVLSEKHEYETWANFPKDRRRLLKLLQDSIAKSKIILSGDRHFGEISRYEFAPGNALFEVTASGLTHAYKEAEEINPYRVGKLWPYPHFGMLDIFVYDHEIVRAEASITDLQTGKKVTAVSIPIKEIEK